MTDDPRIDILTGALQDWANNNTEFVVDVVEFARVVLRRLDDELIPDQT
jgi:hypothetical protein